ncbi:MAG: Trm112 family protein [Candidatus Rifleibacteriota bacterium]
MPIKKELLDVLACPACHGKLVYDENNNRLNCENCKRSYPIKDDIPVMLIEEAVFLKE